MDVGAWLRDLGLERYEQAFRDNAIDGEVLPELTEVDLEKLGVLLGHRKKLLRAAATLSAATAVEPEAPAPARVPQDAERRQLTVVFIDLVGSTALSARLDPEEMREVLRDYQNAVAGEITRFEGHVAKYMGDGVIAYFGWPRAHEDDAERAVRAGLATVDAVGHVLAPDGTGLATRVGIATGPVVVGDLIGEGPAQEEAVVGETPNLAARLQGLAAPCQIVIAESTRRLLGGLFEVTDLGVHELKGFDASIAAFAVKGERTTQSRFEARSGQAVLPMVGREQELALLLERWAQAKAGEGQGVLLVGEAGIGKSRIGRALLDALAEEPHTRIRYQCSPYHTDSALWPVIQQLNYAAGLGGDASVEDRLDKLEALLDRAGGRDAVPLIADLIGLDGALRYGRINLTPQAQRARTLAALVDQQLGLAARQPVLMVLEDAHWIDPTTLEMIGQALDRIADARVLILLTSRPDQQPALAAHPHVTRLTLNRLGRAGVEAIVARLGGERLPPGTIDAIIARTDGVPLFVEELTKAVLETGETTIPATLHDSLMARLDRIPGIKEVAQIGAAIGREFPDELLAAVVFMDVASMDHDHLRNSLDRLVASELVFRRGTPAATTYVFKHALVRDAAYQSLLKSRRQQLHARIAAALEARVEDAQREPELLAHHYRQAGLLERAIPYATQAGDVAFGRFAFVEASARYQEAMDMAQALPPSERASRLQFRAMLKLAHIYQLLGEFGHMPANEAYPKAKSAATTALKLDPTSAEANYVLAIILGLYDWDWAHSENSYQKALELDPNSLRAHQDYGILLLTPLGRHDEAISELERAVELDPSVAWSHVDLAGALNHARRPDQATSRLLNVIERNPMTPHAHRHLGFACVQRGKHEQALAEFQKTVELTGGEAFAAAQLGWAYGVAGKKDEAQRLMDQLKSRGEREHIDPLAFAWLNIGLGDTDAAFFCLERAYEARSSWLIFLKVHQIYEPLHADPRYDDLLRRLGLPSQVSAA